MNGGACMVSSSRGDVDLILNLDLLPTKRLPKTKPLARDPRRLPPYCVEIMILSWFCSVRRGPRAPAVFL